ncbi:hypothetical protein [Streptomyces sp. NPDC050848]
MARIRVLTKQYAQRTKALEGVWRDLYEQSPDTVPHIWHPVDDV